MTSDSWSGVGDFDQAVGVELVTSGSWSGVGSWSGFRKLEWSW